MRSPEQQFNALTPEQEKQAKAPKTPGVSIEKTPIAETETAISYLGVTLEKAKNAKGQFVPRREKYADFVNDKEFALPFQRDLAVSFLSGSPLLAEGGTSLGKTTTVRKMAAELGWEVHYANFTGATDVENFMGRYVPNPFKIDRTKLTDEQYAKIVESWKTHTVGMDPSALEAVEYIFADGKVTSGLRQEEDKVKVIVLDEINAASPNILIRLHEVLDAIERGENVILSEDASEAIPVDKNKTKIVAFMNPPGKGYLGLEPLSPAQLRRWVYKKLPSELPDQTFSEYSDALVGLRPKTIADISVEQFLLSREQTLAVEQLAEVPGFPEVWQKYKEFHKAAKELLKNRKIAEDQPQPFTYDDRMEPRRVRDFVLRFYNGDVSETFRRALRYYYSNKLESGADRRKLYELISLVEYKPKPAETKRKGPEREPKKEPKETEKKEEKAETREPMPETKLEGPVAEQIETAIKKLGKENVFGPEAVEATFGVRVREIPGIPFSVEELERAAKLDQILVLRVDKTEDGKPMSLETMHDILVGTEENPGKWAKEGKGEILQTADAWKIWIGEHRFKKEAPRPGWALVSKDLLMHSAEDEEEYGAEEAKRLFDSTSKNYIEQTEVIIRVLREKAFKDIEVPEEYEEAIREFESNKKRLTRQAAEQLIELKITKLTRQFFPETIYDAAMYYDRHNDRLLPGKYTLSASLDPFGALVYLGGHDATGVLGGRWGPSDTNGTIGVSLSRRL